jgi:hypothetical protein
MRLGYARFAMFPIVVGAAFYPELRWAEKGAFRCPLGETITLECGAGEQVLDSVPFRGDYAGDTCQIVGDADVGPVGRIEKRSHGREAVVSQFEDQDSAGLEVRSGLRDQVAIEFVSLFAAKQRLLRFMVPDFARQRSSFATADVRGIAGNQIKNKWRR